MAIEVGSLQATLVANVRSFVTGMRQAQQAFQQTNNAINQGGGALNRLQGQFNSTTSAVQGFTGALKNVKGVAVGGLAAIGAYNIIPSIFQAAKSALIDFNQQVDQSTIALTSFLGSATEAQGMIKELQDFAARTPFQFKDLLGTVQSMMAMGVASKDVIPRMRAIGDAAAALGGTPEVMFRIQRALGQIQAKGRVQSEELLQLAEAGIPAYQYLADALGTTTADMLGDLRKGTVDANTAITAVLDGMARDFGGMMEEQAKTMMGALSTVKDYVQITMGAITRPIFDAFRNTFVAIADFLGSEGAASGAKRFAEAIAGIINSLQKGLVEAFNALKEPMTTIVKAIIDVATAAIRLGKAIAPMATMIAAVFVGALVAVVKAIAPVVGAIGSLVKFLSEFKFVVQAVATILVSKWVLGMIQAQMASGGFGTALVGLIGKMGAFGKIFKFQVVNNIAGGVPKLAAFRAAAQLTFTSIAASAKAMGIAIASSLGPMILITAAVMGLTKLWQAFSSRNKDAEERTKELTQAIKEQTDALTGNSVAIEEYIGGTEGLSRALLETGENGDRFATALSYFADTDAVSAIEGFQSNVYGTAKAMALAAGETESSASAIAAWVATTDKGSESAHRSALEAKGWSERSIQLAMALEEINDQAENTNLNDLAKTQVENIAKTNNFAKALRDQAMKTVEARKATDASITTDNYWLMVREEMALLLSRYNDEQEAAALAAKLLADSEYDVVAAILAAKDAAKDGILETDDYTKALFGNALGALQMQRSIRNMNLELGGLIESVKKTGGNFEGLRSQGYKLFDQLMNNSTAVLNMGGTMADVVAVMEQQVEQFKQAAIAAGFEEEKVNGLLESLGVLAAIKNIKTKIDVEVGQAAELLKEYLQILARLQSETARAKMEEAIGKLRDIIAQSKQTVVSTGNSFKAMTDSMGGASKETATLADAQEALKERIKDQRRAVVEARQALQDYARESASAISKAVSLGSVLDRYNKMRDKNEQILDRNRQIREKMEEDRIAKERENARKLVDIKNKQIEAENRLIELQNQFAEAVGESVSSVLSFSGVANQQANAISEYQKALSEQSEAQAKANEAQAEYQTLAGKVAQLQQKLATTTGRYARRTLGEELAKAQEEAQGALEKYTEAQSELAVATNAANDAQSKQITFLQGLEQQASRAVKFGAIIDQLVAAGLSRDALRQIADAGAEVGTTLGEELLAGGIDAITKANVFAKQVIDEGERVTKIFSQSLKDKLEYEIYDDKPVYEELGKEVGETFAQSLAAQAEKAKMFTAKVRQLIGMGLRGTQLEEVVNAGVDAGTEIADALIASGAETIQQSVAIQDELKALSIQFGDELVPHFDQTGVLLAQAMLDAMEKTLANLPSILAGKTGKQIYEWIQNLDKFFNDKMRDIADKIAAAGSGTPSGTKPSGTTGGGTTGGGTSSSVMAKAIENYGSEFAQAAIDTLSNYGMNSSTVAKIVEQNIGNPLVAGGIPDYLRVIQEQAGSVAAVLGGGGGIGGSLYEATMFAKGGIVTAPTLGIVGEAGAEAIIPLNQLGNFGGNSYNIVVNAGMGTNGSQVGAQIVEAIKKYEKSNGTRWRS